MSDVWKYIIIIASVCAYGLFFYYLGKIHFAKWKKSQMSKHGILLPPPKIGLPSRLENPEKLHDYVWEHIHMRELERVLGLPEEYGITLGVDKAQFNWPYSHNIKVAWQRDLEDFNRHWRIERSRADHLEEMVDRLQQEVNDLKGNNGWLRRLFPRRN